MKRIAMLVVAVLVVSACERNRAPSLPELSGPNSGRPGEILVFNVTAIDPEGDEVAYKIVWGDTSSIDWSPFYASGQQVRREHVYADSGNYVIRVMARDAHMLETGWSQDFPVAVRLLPPGEPQKPDGPAFCTTGVSYEYRFRASHPQNDSLWYQVDWGGAVADWRGPVPSDSWFKSDHTYDTAGVYAVAVRARDSRGQMTVWSDTLLVTVVMIPGGPPTGCSLAAATDTTVRLSWSPPLEGVPNKYRVSFKEIGGQGFAVVAETTVLAVVHNPHGLTGTYKIAAIFGSAVYEDTIPLSTVPKSTGTITVGELSGPDKPGCGWSRLLGTAKSFQLTDTLYCDSVDWFCTDFAAGSSGPVYYVASPDTAPFDQGGNVPQGRWHSTLLARLADEQGPVPAPGDTALHKVVALGTAVPVSFGVKTQDGYYGVVKVTQIRIANEDIRVQAWFQSVRGLRLVRH